MTVNRHSGEISERVLGELGERASTLLSRSIETALGEITKAARIRRQGVVWPTLIIVATRSQKIGAEPVVKLDATVEFTEFDQLGTAWATATAPAFVGQLIAADRKHESLAASYASMEAHALESDRRLRIIREELVRLTGEGKLDRADAARMVSVIIGETAGLEQEPVASDAAEAWRQE